jgi:hypothetical protein
MPTDIPVPKEEAGFGPSVRIVSLAGAEQGNTETSSRLLNSP